MGLLMAVAERVQGCTLLAGVLACFLLPPSGGGRESVSSSCCLDGETHFRELRLPILSFARALGFAWHHTGNASSTSILQLNDDTANKPFSSTTRPTFRLPLHVRLRVAALMAFGLAWFFFLGAALGSYLNVVVFRLPRGRSSAMASSRCPHCNHTIRPYDNIPVVSWLVLRGKCRDCQAPIDLRYVLVELLLGCLFLGLMCVEIFSGGANLPLRESRAYASQPWIDHFGEWDLLGMFAYHALLLWLLVGWMLFRVDHVTVPYRFTRWAIAAGLFFPLMWPQLRPVHLQNINKTQVGCFVGMADGLLGVAAGVVATLMTASAAVVMHKRSMHAVAWRNLEGELVGPLALAGLFLGWQAAFSVALLAVWWLCMGRFASLIRPTVARWPVTAVVLLAVLTQLVAWSWLNGVYGWPGPQSSLGGALACSVIGMAAAALLAWNIPRRRVARRTQLVDSSFSIE